MGKHFPPAIGSYTALTRNPHLQPQRMPDHRYVGDPADHGVTTPAARTVTLTVPEQHGFRTRIICQPGPITAHRHGPISQRQTPLSALHFGKSPETAPSERLSKRPCALPMMSRGGLGGDQPLAPSAHSPA